MDFAAPSKAPSTKQACDNCRRRKIKCSRDLPCDKCQRLLLSCSYSDVLRRKGPKFRTSYTLALIHPVPARGDTATPYQVCSAADKFADQSGFRISSPTSSPLQSTMHPLRQIISPSRSQLPPSEQGSSPDSTDINTVDSSAYGPIIPPRIARLSSHILLVHVNVYLKYLFPIMPVVRGDQLRHDCHQSELLLPQRYAFLAALCAATHIQLKLDGADPIPDQAQLHCLGDGMRLSRQRSCLRKLYGHGGNATWWRISVLRIFSRRSSCSPRTAIWINRHMRGFIYVRRLRWSLHWAYIERQRMQTCQWKKLKREDVYFGFSLSQKEVTPSNNQNR